MDPVDSSLLDIENMTAEEWRTLITNRLAKQKDVFISALKNKVIDKIDTCMKCYQPDPSLTHLRANIANEINETQFEFEYQKFADGIVGATFEYVCQLIIKNSLDNIKRTQNALNSFFPTPYMNDVALQPCFNVGIDIQGSYLTQIQSLSESKNNTNENTTVNKINATSVQNSKSLNKNYSLPVEVNMSSEINLGNNFVYIQPVHSSVAAEVDDSLKTNQNLLSLAMDYSEQSTQFRLPGGNLEDKNITYTGNDLLLKQTKICSDFASNKNDEDMMSKLTNKLSILESFVNDDNRKLETHEPNVIEPEIIETEVLESKVVEQVIIRPEVIEPEVRQSEVLEPKVVESGIISPEVIEREVRQPKVLEPKVVEPGIIRPEVIEPEVKQPEFLEQKVVESGVIRPEVIEPEILELGIIRSEVVELEDKKLEVLEPRDIELEIIGPEVLKPKDPEQEVIEPESQHFSVKTKKKKHSKKSKTKDSSKKKHEKSKESAYKCLEENSKKIKKHKTLHSKRDKKSNKKKNSKDNYEKLENDNSENTFSSNSRKCSEIKNSKKIPQQILSSNDSETELLITKNTKLLTITKSLEISSVFDNSKDNLLSNKLKSSPDGAENTLILEKDNSTSFTNSNDSLIVSTSSFIEKDYSKSESFCLNKSLDYKKIYEMDRKNLFSPDIILKSLPAKNSTSLHSHKDGKTTDINFNCSRPKTEVNLQCSTKRKKVSDRSVIKVKIPFKNLELQALSNPISSSFNKKSSRSKNMSNRSKFKRLKVLNESDDENNSIDLECNITKEEEGNAALVINESFDVDMDDNKSSDRNSRDQERQRLMEKYSSYNLKPVYIVIDPNKIYL